jgi:hypothetical protein
MTCTNNLKQIAIAALSYESANATLPPGGFMGGTNTGTYGSYPGATAGPLAAMLPYLEQEAVFKQLPTNLFLDPVKTPGYNVAPWAYGTAPYSTDGNQTGPPPGSEATIKTFICPSDNVTTLLSSSVGGSIDVFAPGDDCSGQFNAASFCIDYFYDLTGTFAPRQPGASNYVGCAGGLGSYSGRADTTYYLYPGIYYLKSVTRLSDILDGTSNTLAFGEALLAMAKTATSTPHGWRGVAWRLLGVCPAISPLPTGTSTPASTQAWWCSPFKTAPSRACAHRSPHSPTDCLPVEPMVRLLRAIIDLSSTCGSALSQARCRTLSFLSF